MLFRQNKLIIGEWGLDQLIEFLYAWISHF
jgi:hypothetical protein